MRPRLLTRTHYQVDEPAYLRLLVLACSSCTQSDYSDRLAARLVDELGRRGQDLNIGAARYGVDLARAIGLLTDNNTWTDLGMLLYTVSGARDDFGDLKLTASERLFFFRLFLEADGAALIFLGKLLADCGQLPVKGQTWVEGTNRIANDMFAACFAEYLDLAAEPVERVKLRQVLERRNARPFHGNSGRHQMSVHLQTMYRLGLVGRSQQNNSRAYYLPEREDFHGGLWALTRCVPDARALEDTLKERAWPVVAARVFQTSLPGLPAGADESLGRDLLEHLLPTYDIICATGVPLCSLTALVESLQIRQLLRTGKTVTYTKALEMLTGLQRRHPREVRFHVDRTGQPAFVKFSDGFGP